MSSSIASPFTAVVKKIKSFSTYVHAINFRQSILCCLIDTKRSLLFDENSDATRKANIFTFRVTYSTGDEVP